MLQWFRDIHKQKTLNFIEQLSPKSSLAMKVLSFFSFTPNYNQYLFSIQTVAMTWRKEIYFFSNSLSNFFPLTFHFSIFCITFFFSFAPSFGYLKIHKETYFRFSVIHLSVLMSNANILLIHLKTKIIMFIQE